MPTFPRELTDEIIAWIPIVCDRVIYNERETYRTLLSCSLVCSAWLPASRHQLFLMLHINTPERYDLLVSRVLHSEKMRIHLLSVRSVIFVTRVNDTLESTDSLLRRPFVHEFAGHLPTVTYMAFFDQSADPSFNFLSHPTSAMVISRFSLVRSLSISRCMFPSFRALCRTLTALPSLNDLELNLPSWPEPAADLSTHLSHGASTVRRPALLALDVMWATDPPDRRCAQQFMAWLSKTATSSSLLNLWVRVLNWEHVKIEDMATFGPSFLRFGQGLRLLDIHFDFGGSGIPGPSSYSFVLSHP